MVLMIDLPPDRALWSKASNYYCYTKYSKKYSTLAQAQAACDSSCYGVYDGSCDGRGEFLLCAKTDFFTSSRGSCVYTPPNQKPIGLFGCESIRCRLVDCVLGQSVGWSFFKEKIHAHKRGDKTRAFEYSLILTLTLDGAATTKPGLFG